MTPLDDLPFPDRVAELRRRGLSQRELGAAVRRSESWVSQVERGVQPVERFAVLQALADALGVPVSTLRPDTSTATQAAPSRVERSSELDSLRLALAGHPSLEALFAGHAPSEAVDRASLRKRVAYAWELTHASRFNDLAQELTSLLPELESELRTARAAGRRPRRRWRSP